MNTKDITKVSKKFVVYELTNIKGMDRYNALEYVYFDDYETNSFATKKDAVKALVNNKMRFKNYVILKQITLG